MISNKDTLCNCFFFFLFVIRINFPSSLAYPIDRTEIIESRFGTFGSHIRSIEKIIVYYVLSVAIFSFVLEIQPREENAYKRNCTESSSPSGVKRCTQALKSPPRRDASFRRVNCCRTKITEKSAIISKIKDNNCPFISNV